ncbi:MAG: hypothetical protein JWP54_145 [Cryobacterium sp.]|nr:hypothetical protein [Cryobacterium sp.]
MRRHGRVPKQIFVPARGQFDNIGDILLRRQLLDWLRGNGPLHVYLGQSPAGYAEGLRLRPEDVQYRSFKAWYLAALRSAVRGSASYVFKPGEIQLTMIGMKEHLSMLPVLALVRARGGVVARVGVGSRNFARVPRALIWPSIALSNLTLWRDSATAEYLGNGSVMPDLGFGEGGGGAAAQSDAGRNLLIVSMRADQPYPSTPWLAAVREIAARHGLHIRAVTQVLRDNDRTIRLAADLGGEAVGWDGTGHDGQEERLRQLYRRAVIAVSDRLHVLVGAVTEGAVPAALLVNPSDKIARHFAAAGIHDVSIATAGLSATELSGQLEHLIGRRESIQSQLLAARGDLRSANDRLDQVLSGVPAR